MKDRLNNILILSVTLFLSACSVNEKLDQNLAEMRDMNKNMAEMNKNMANGISEFSDVGKSVKAMSDEAVLFLKKTDPQQYFDMFNKISDKFEEMLSGLMDQTGDIKGFVTKANEATQLFLDYSKHLTPEDLGTVKESLDKISGMTTQINDLLAKSGNYEAMANQIFLTTQMFAAVGLSLGQSLDIVNPKDASTMMTLMEANMQSINMLGSTKSIADEMMSIDKRIVARGAPNKNPQKNNKLIQAMDGLVKTVIPDIEKLSNLWNDPTKSLNEKWDELDDRYSKILCFAMSTLLEFSKMDPPGPNPITDKQKEDIQKQYDLMKPKCEEKKTTPKQHSLGKEMKHEQGPYLT